MDAIEEYFQGEYIQEKNKIKEIDELVDVVIKSLTNTTPDKNKGWPYEITAKTGINQSDDKYSFSTNAMILFVLAKFKGKIEINSPLLPSIEWAFNKNLKEQFEGFDISEYYKVFNDKSKNLSTEYTKSKDTENLIISKSGSFGFNDPFTFSWIAELLSKTYNTDDNPFKEIQSNFIDESTRIIDSIFVDKFEGEVLTFDAFYENGKTFEKSPRKASNHIFPLLRVIHLYKTISKLDPSKINDIDILRLFTNLQNRINQQISHYTVQNSLFDTAELVMSLEGILVLDENRRIDDNLVRKVFDILETNQKNNLNWRPLKPFVTSAQGDVLLPLSIEIANSLLRICKLLERHKQYYFHEYAPIFNKYTQWLLANVSQCTVKGGNTYKGWRSEHVQEADVIHPWETAQVLTYLMTYKTMIQERIAHKSLKKCGLSCSEEYLLSEDGETEWKDKWEKSETGTKNYKEIRETYFDRKADNVGYSMLLFGPPGTGKTAIGEDLAAALKWRLITITPSDFIKNGEADVEGRAKSIFKTLEEQKDCVILFDEIDRLILDRDSIYYNNQGDMFQFMTPSMLVKIKDLRKAEKCIFIIATNYAERIDSAIKRAGRIDHKYLINLPNKDQRLDILKELIGKNINKSIASAIISSDSDTYITQENTEVENLKKEISSLNERKLSPENETKISEIEKEIIASKKELKKKKKNLAKKVAEILLDEKVALSTSVSVGESLAKETVFCAYGELDAFVKQACKEIGTREEFSEKIMEVLKDQDKPAVRLSNYRRRFQKDQDKNNLPIYPYKEFFNLLDLQLEVSHISETLEEKKQIEGVFKNVTETIDQVVRLDNFDLKDYENKALKCYELLLFLRAEYENAQNAKKPE